MKDIRHFTIFIPTRDRADTLIHTINSALAQDYENFTVLVSDNASTDNTRDLVNSIADPRLKYINTEKRVSMSHNWEFGLNFIDSGWVTVLGDDDAILPGALSRVNEIIQKTNVRAIRSNGCSYRWPCLDNTKYGSLSLSLKKSYRKVSSDAALRSALKGDINYTDLPVLYNGGFVDVSLLQQVKEKSRVLIQSINPDVYLGVVLSLLTSEYVYSDEPLAVNGASKHSGGTAFFETRKQNREYDPFTKFIQEDNIPFHEDLPLMQNGIPVRSLSVLLYEAYLQASIFHSLKNINVNHATQLKVFLSKNNKFHDEVLEFSKLFAKNHGLKLDLSDLRHGNNVRHELSKTLISVIVQWPLKQVARIKSLWSTTIGIQGSKTTPLSNVFEASIVAGLLKDIPVGGPYWQIKSVLRSRAKRDQS